MNAPDEPELTPNDVEEMLVRYGERLPVDVDPDRLRETLLNAVGVHPDRGWIIEQIHAGATLFLVFPRPPLSDVFELRLAQPGYDPALPIPADDPELHDRSIRLGDVELGHALRRPQG